MSYEYKTVLCRMLNLLGAVTPTFEKHQVNYEASSAFRSIDTCQMD